MQQQQMHSVSAGFWQSEFLQALLRATSWFALQGQGGAQQHPVCPPAALLRPPSPCSHIWGAAPGRHRAAPLGAFGLVSDKQPCELAPCCSPCQEGNLRGSQLASNWLRASSGRAVCPSHHPPALAQAGTEPPAEAAPSTHTALRSTAGCSSSSCSVLTAPASAAAQRAKLSPSTFLC